MALATRPCPALATARPVEHEPHDEVRLSGSSRLAGALCLAVAMGGCSAPAPKQVPVAPVPVEPVRELAQVGQPPGMLSPTAPIAVLESPPEKPVPLPSITVRVVKHQKARRGRPRMSAHKVDVAGIIEEKAERRGLDPWLVRAVMKVESGFRPQETSPRGARGLMQVMPDTGRELGVRNLYDPASNIEAGTRYLAELWDRFHDWDLVIAAYNAGPNRVARDGGIPNIRETRDYVQRVKAAWEEKPQGI